MKYTFFFSECTEKDLGEMGEKAYGIAQLFRKGYKVPPGFIISRSAFEGVAQEKFIRAAVHELSICPEGSIRSCSERLSNLIHSYELSESLSDEIIEAYLSLSVDLSMSVASLLETKEVFVAVRGSIISKSSFPGVHHKTTLNVKGKAKLFSAIMDDYSDTLVEAIIQSRGNQDIKDFSMSIIVQKMINAEKSGIAYPSPETPKGIVLKACFGLGNGLTSEGIVPDIYNVDTEDYIIKSREISDKKFEFVRDIDSQETIMQELGDKSRKEVLYDDEAIEIAKALKKIGVSFGKPQQVEWVMKGKILYLLQANDAKVGDYGTKERVEMEITGDAKPPEIIDISDMEDDLKALEQIEILEKEPASIKIEQPQAVSKITLSEQKIPENIIPQAKDEPKAEKKTADEELSINLGSDVPGDDDSSIDLGIDLPGDEDFILPQKENTETLDPLVEQALKSAGDTIVLCHKAVEDRLRKKLLKYSKTVPASFTLVVDELKKYEEVKEEKDLRELDRIKEDYAVRKKYLKADEIIKGLKLMEE